MNPKSPAVSNPLVEAPLTNFSNCHAGIIGHLDAFGDMPRLLDAAQRARDLAEETVQFFRVAVFDHHAEEEKDLFPAVLAAASAGAERDRVKGMVDALVTEHREIEALWRALEPGLSKLANGHLTTTFDRTALVSLVQKYHAHARLEEERFLPMAESILGRQDKKMADLGLALHMRQAVKAARRGLRGS